MITQRCSANTAGPRGALTTIKENAENLQRHMCRDFRRPLGWRERD